MSAATALVSSDKKLDLQAREFDRRTSTGFCEVRSSRGDYLILSIPNLSFSSSDAIMA